MAAECVGVCDGKVTQIDSSVSLKSRPKDDQLASLWKTPKVVRSLWASFDPRCVFRPLNILIASIIDRCDVRRKNRRRVGQSLWFLFIVFAIPLMVVFDTLLLIVPILSIGAWQPNGQTQLYQVYRSSLLLFSALPQVFTLDIVWLDHSSRLTHNPLGYGSFSLHQHIFSRSLCQSILCFLWQVSLFVVTALCTILRRRIWQVLPGREPNSLCSFDHSFVHFVSAMLSVVEYNAKNVGNSVSNSTTRSWTWIQFVTWSEVMIFCRRTVCQSHGAGVGLVCSNLSPSRSWVAQSPLTLSQLLIELT